MTRVTQLIHDAGKYLLISVYPLPTHPTHNFTHNNGGNLETLPGWPKKLQHNRPARSAGQKVLLHSQRTHDAIATPLLRQNDVVASFWRKNDVIIVSCVRWVAGSLVWRRGWPGAFLLKINHSITEARTMINNFIHAKQYDTSNGSWCQGIKGEMTCTVYVALVWNIIYWIMMIITLFTE